MADYMRASFYPLFYNINLNKMKKKYIHLLFYLKSICFELLVLLFVNINYLQNLIIKKYTIHPKKTSNPPYLLKETII